MDERQEIDAATCEAVTAPGSSQDNLTGEAAELREAWQSLGELLRKSQVAESPSWAAVLIDELAPSAVVIRRGHTAVKQRHRWRARLVALTIAGSLAGVAALWYGLSGADSNLLDRSKSAGGATAVASVAAKRELVAKQDIVGRSEPSTQRRESDLELAVWSWDDPLDWQLDQATVSLATMREQWRSRASDYEIWQWRLEELRADLDRGAL